MKIVHVGYSHRPDDIRIYQKECLSLEKCGHEVFYVTSNRNCKHIEVPHSKVQVILLKLSRPDNRLRCVFYWEDLKRVLSFLDADVYHFHEFYILPLLFYMKRRGKKVIYDLHEDTPRDMQPGIYKRYGKIIGKLIIRLVEIYENYHIKKADYIITATPHIAERCRKLSKNVECIANYPIIHENGKADEEFDESEKTGESISETHLKEPILCYCGSMTEDRNISMYVKMMEQIEGKLFLAGALDDSYRKELEGITSWRKVKCLGYLDRSGVARLYRESDIGLCILKNIPNTYYGFPNKIFEYMEAGLPVICSDFPNYREIVEGNNCGIAVPCNDIVAAIKAVKEIRSHPELAVQMGENGRKAVREKYNWKTEEKKLLKLYHGLD